MMKLSLIEGKPVLSLGGTTLGIDNHLGEHSFISHAHSDHSSFGRRAKRVLVNPATLSLMRARGAYTAFETSSEADFGGVKVSLVPSGHVLGSAMLYAEDSDGRSFLYTGDFKTSPSLTAGAAPIIHADTLLMECTYGHPQYSFPPREVVYKQLGKWVESVVASGEIAVVGAYSLGKAQEVIKAINDHSGAAPYVNAETKRICDVYCRHGVELSCRSMDGAPHDGNAFAAVVPLNMAGPELAANLEEHYRMPARTAVATGWSGSRNYGADESFELSDHEDFNGLVEFVKQVNPKHVYCTHGYSDVFAGELAKIGFDAVPLDEISDARQVLLEA